MADFTCPYAKQTGSGGIIVCTKPQKETPPTKQSKGKKKAAQTEQAKPAAPQTCGHQRYCPQKRKCILTEQAAICPLRKD